MSDYLWDKSGEPDADVERLEEMLGRLRHAGVAPELPLEVGAHATARAGLFGSAGILRPARLAAAAALLLAMLAGAFVLLRTFKSDGGRASVQVESRGAEQRAAAPEQKSAPAEVREREERRAPEVVSSPPKESATPERQRRVPPARDALAVVKTPPKSQRREPAPREAIAGEQQRRALRPAFAPGGGFEGVAPDAQGRAAAKERLVYALRLTSEALKEVRGRASGANAFVGRDPLR